jgi:hypothetical protein
LWRAPKASTLPPPSKARTRGRKRNVRGLRWEEAIIHGIFGSWRYSSHQSVPDIRDNTKPLCI